MKRSFSILLLFFVCIVLLVMIVVIALPNLMPQVLSEKDLLSYAEYWPIQFRDPFDDHSLSHWDPSDGRIEGGINQLIMKVGHFEVSFAPTKDMIVRDAFFNGQAHASKNFLLTLKVKPPLSCHTGLVFRGTAQGEYYVFLVGNDSYTAEILRRNNDVDAPREAILPNIPFPEGVGQPYTLNVLGSGSRYDLYINRIFVDTFRDDRLQGEQAGIEFMVCNGVSTESVFRVDEFSLRTPYWVSLKK